MSPHSDLIESWNEIFSFNITENNLEFPDEQFLFNALVTLLERFNADCREFLTMYSSENYEHRRLLRMKLVRYVDYFYKFSGKTHTFYYYDLIKPTPKKTAHLLHHLLNYYLYYQMMKDEVMSTVGTKFEEREDILKQKDILQRENNELAIKASSIDQKIKELLEALPKLDEKILKYKRELEQLEKVIDENKARLNDQNDMIGILKEIYETEEKKVVSPEEVEYIRKKITFAQNAIDKQESILTKVESSKKEISDLFIKRETISKKLENILSEFQVEDLTSFRTSDETLEIISLELINQKKQNEEMKNKIEDLERKYKEAENKMELTMEMLNKEKSILEKVLKDRELALAEKNQQYNDAIHELGTMRNKLENSKEDEERIIQMMTDFLQIVFSHSNLNTITENKET